jgi:3-phosphoshikimate 1-carboxyvinyltransferase
VDAGGDHRIAMAAAVASCAVEGKVLVRGAESSRVSYPQFERDFRALGGSTSEVETR